MLNYYKKRQQYNNTILISFQHVFKFLFNYYVSIVQITSIIFTKIICKITNTVSCRFSNNSLITNSIYY